VVKVAPIPFPLTGDDQVVESILDRVSEKTRLLLVDHVTSQTGVVLPVHRLVVEMAARDVDVLIDGAHAPGMLELDLETLGASFYTGNCHKWMCAPKGAAFLHVRDDHHDVVRPLVISHGANASTAARSRFHLEHDWTGTRDPSAWLAVPAAIRVMEQMLDGGWGEIRRHNRRLVIEGRKILCDALSIDEPCPEGMIGSLASVRLPDGMASSSEEPLSIDPLQNHLLDEWGIEVPVIGWPSPPQRLVRISAQLYNSREQYAYLAHALTNLAH
jgi:isopenicillin-N epimerase